MSSLAIISLLKAASSLTGVISDGTIELALKGNEGVLTGPLPKLREDTEKQKLAMEMAQAQARVAQELAIARRIELASEVQIEEYYEYAGEGSLGFKANDKGITLGAAGSGQRISKRIYRFVGGSLPTAELASALHATETAPAPSSSETILEQSTQG